MNIDEKPRNKRRERYSHSIADAAKDKCREEGKARQEAYNKLTIAEKIAKLDAGGFTAKRQRAKFEAEMNKELLQIAIKEIDKELAQEFKELAQEELNKKVAKNDKKRTNRSSRKTR